MSALALNRYQLKGKLSLFIC